MAEPLPRRVQFEIEDCPPSRSNNRGHWSKHWQEQKMWFATAVLLGNAARNAAGWPKAVAGEKRTVTITTYRVKLLDPGNAYDAVKHLVDGLQTEVLGKSQQFGAKYISIPKQGAGLIWRDDQDHCELPPPPQIKVYHYKDQRTVVEVERASD